MESLFNKVAGLLSCNFIKKRPKHRCFLVKFVKFLRTAILKNIYGRLLLHATTNIFLWTLKNFKTTAQPCFALYQASLTELFLTTAIVKSLYPLTIFAKVLNKDVEVNYYIGCFKVIPPYIGDLWDGTKCSLYLHILSFLNETISYFWEVSIAIVLFKINILFSTKFKSLLSERSYL